MLPNPTSQARGAANSALSNLSSRAQGSKRVVFPPHLRAVAAGGAVARMALRGAVATLATLAGRAALAERAGAAGYGGAGGRYHLGFALAALGARLLATSRLRDGHDSIFAPLLLLAILSGLFIPPSTAIASHPALLQALHQLDFQLTELETDAFKIIHKVKLRPDKRGPLADLVRELAERTVFALAQQLTTLRLMAAAQPPVYLLDALLRV
nr:hypothetical protein [Tanacetum cinerariifolium]